jgi:DNA/RNA endonuclease G (NUC1)
VSNGLKGVRSVAVAVLLLLVGSAWAEVCPGAKVPKAEREQYDAQATLSATESELALKTHLPWGQPACPKLLPAREYILCYSPASRLALWAAYQLRAEDVVSATRRDAFRTDPRLTDEDSAHCADYAGSGYDRGHTVPNADMNRSSMAQANTFFLSNMTPQSPALNRGLWRYLEELVRDYAKKYGVVYILTGSILQEPVQTVPSGRVGIPSRYYKTLLRLDANGTITAALSIYLPNLLEGLPVPPGSIGVQGQKISAEVTDAFLAGHTVSIRELETLTGIDLLPKLDGEALKRAVASEVWPRN